MNILPRSFYGRKTPVVASELIGKILVVSQTNTQLTGRIIEAEAYEGAADPASHAYRGVTKRNAVMFGPPGFVYVYFIYGNHYCLNVVTEKDGVPGAVLIRGIEPRKGIRHMMKRRRVRECAHCASGPGKLTEACGITKKDNGSDLVTGSIRIADDEKEADVIEVNATPRIGISRGQDLLYRYCLEK